MLFASLSINVLLVVRGWRVNSNFWGEKVHSMSIANSMTCLTILRGIISNQYWSVRSKMQFILLWVKFVFPRKYENSLESDVESLI